MCGIVTLVKREKDETKTAETIKEMLMKQISRGREGFGYVSFGDEMEAYVRRETLVEIESVLENSDSRSIMFHHRYPTSTPNLADCAHPIRVSHKELKFDYYLIHNGMISNCSVTKKDFNALGYVYSTEVRTETRTQNSIFEQVEFNDSESLAIDVARFIEGKQDKIRSNGSIAFVVLQMNKKTSKMRRVFWGRNYSPLTIKLTDKQLVLRSEGEEEVVERDTLYSLDLKTWQVEKSKVDIGEMISSRNYSKSSPAWDNDDYYADDRNFPVPTPKINTHQPSLYGNTVEITNYEETVCDEIGTTFAMGEIAIIDAKIEDIGMEINSLEEEIAEYEQNGHIDFAKQCREEIEKLEEKIDQLNIRKDEIITEYEPEEKF